jgi:hypothetical protein
MKSLGNFPNRRKNARRGINEYENFPNRKISPLQWPLGRPRRPRSPITGNGLEAVRSLAKKKGPMTCVRCQYGCQNRPGTPGNRKASCRACQGHAFGIACPLRASRSPACSVRKLHDGTILMVIDLAIIGIALVLGEPKNGSWRWMVG